MLRAATCTRGMVTAPHHLAAESGLAVLREGGNAIEAMVAAAATIAVVYPHMNSIGGDGFWLVHAPGVDPIAIDACGAAGSAVDRDRYRARGLTTIPARGPLAANTVAGTVSGWLAALQIGARWGGRLPRERLLEDAIHYAEKGFPVTAGQHRLTIQKLAELADAPGFAQTFLPEGHPPALAQRFCNPRLAATLRTLAARGFDDFYRGELAQRITADLRRAGAPLTAEDLASQQARERVPLGLRTRAGHLYNLPPPTQGLASLMILGMFERLGVTEAEGFAHLHGLVEATKQAFLVRDREITDPEYMHADATHFLGEETLSACAAAIDPQRALPWPQPSAPGDTIWMGAIDDAGRAASFIQSLYWEFGSGVVLEETGIQWQNRGSSFDLDPAARNPLTPGRRPFHTLNPALALLADGRTLVYGTMGGEGQPQTQAAVFTRYVHFGQDLQQAVTAPRWLLGRTWGEQSTTLKLESRFPAQLVQDLREAGHRVEVVAAFDDVMGHAGALARHPHGLIEGAADPRSDGRAAGF